MISTDFSAVKVKCQNCSIFGTENKIKQSTSGEEVGGKKGEATGCKRAPKRRKAQRKPATTANWEKKQTTLLNVLTHSHKLAKVAISQSQEEVKVEGGIKDSQQVEKCMCLGSSSAAEDYYFHLNQSQVK